MSPRENRNVEPFLTSVPLFEFVLDRTANRQIASLVDVVDFTRGRMLAREGDVGRGLFILSQGTVKLSKTLSGDRVQIVAFRGAGDIVGLHRSYTPWPVTVEAVSNGSAFRLGWDDLRRLALNHPQVDRVLLDLAGDEVASLQQHLLTLGRKTTEEKVASFLLAFYRSGGLQPHARREIQLPMRRTEIADYLGLTTASVSRELTRLRKEGIVAIPRPSRIVMLDHARLQVIASGPGSQGPLEVVS